MKFQTNATNDLHQTNFSIHLRCCKFLLKNSLSLFLFQQVRPNICEPIDYESYVAKYKEILQNDTQRELLLFPMNDFTVINQTFYSSMTPMSHRRCLTSTNKLLIETKIIFFSNKNLG